MNLRNFSFAAAALFSAVQLNAADPDMGAPILSDEFNVQDFFAEYWQAPRNFKPNLKGKNLRIKGAYITLRKEAPQEFYTEVKIALNTKNPGRFSGFSIRGINFVLRSDGIAWLVWYPKAIMYR